MLENMMKFIKKMLRIDEKSDNSKDAAKERLHLVLIQDRASVSADFLEVMKQEIIEVIKKYIEIDENAIDVRLTNNVNEDGKSSSPALYANFPITNVKTKILKDNSKNNEEEKSIKIEDAKNEKKSVKKNVKKNEKDAVVNIEENK